MEQPLIPASDERAERGAPKLEQFSEAALAKLTEERRRARADLIHAELAELRRKRATHHAPDAS
jgi:hypothetical protein